MFFDINKGLCTMFNGLDPFKLLEYPAEDVFDLIKGTMDYNKRNNEADNKVVRKQAGDDWF